MGLIKKQLIAFGIIEEMRDWKQHFINGTKGMPKTEIQYLNYVEGLLKKAYDGDEEKVNNNQLAPWLVNVIKTIGIENINTEKLNKIKTTIEYVKKTGNVANIPKMDLNGAATFSKEKLDKIAEKEKEKEQKAAVEKEVGNKDVEMFDVDGEEKDKNKTPARVIEDYPLLADEAAGNIKRIWTPGDGSGRMWVQVLKNNWLNQTCGRGRTWGVVCQATTFGGAGYTNIQLIGPPKGNPKGPYTTIIACAINLSNNALAETKQENNVMPGHQKTSGGWDDSDAMLIDLLCHCPDMKNLVKQMGDYNGYLREDLYSGGIGILRDIAKRRMDLLNVLADYRPDIIENNWEYIKKLVPADWMEQRQVDIAELAKDRPFDFIKRLSSLIERFGKEAIDLLQKINLEEIAKRDPNLIINSLGVLIGNIPAQRFMGLIQNLNFSQYITSNPESFKDLFKNMANYNEFRNMFKDLLNTHAQDIINAFGGKITGVFNFMQFARQPRLRQHANAKKDSQTGEYIGVRKKILNPGEGHANRIEQDEEFIIPDNLKVLSQKERRDFINKNKALIQSFVNAKAATPEAEQKAKDISFLRVLFSESNPQEIEKTMTKEKDEFINYYQTKFKAGEKKKVMVDGEIIEAPYLPGVFEYYVALNKNKPNAVVTEAQESVGRKWYYEDDVKTVSYYPVGVEEAKKNIQSIIRYYYDLRKSFEKSNATKANDAVSNSSLFKKQKTIDDHSSEIKLRYESIKDYVKTLEISGADSNELVDYYLTNFNPPRVGFDRTNSTAAFNFYKNIKTFLDKEDAQKKLIELKQEILQIPSGNILFDKLMDDYSIYRYKVIKNMMIQYQGTDGFTKFDQHQVNRAGNIDDDIVIRGINLTFGKKYKVLDTKTFNGIENGALLIQDETRDGNGNYAPRENWFLTNYFDAILYKILPSGTEEIANKKIIKESKEIRTLIRQGVAKIVETEIKKKRVSYTGILLDNKSKQKLEEFIKEMQKQKKMEIPKSWVFTADHVTINMGPAMDKEMIGQTIEMRVIKYAFNDMIAAVVVKTSDDIDFEKNTPHITIAYNAEAGARPVMSNQLTNWKFVPRAFTLTGKIMEVKGI